MNANVVTRLKVVKGDITRLAVETIVNAANSSLLGGGGVDGAIHDAAGPELLAECRRLGGCPTGEARITAGYRLPARHVIHTVGPVYAGGTSGEAELLRSCYRESLRLASETGVRTIAFPCISTGVYGYPKAKACEIAVGTVAEWLASEPLPESVIFCCYGPDDAAFYRAMLEALAAKDDLRQ
jgi:O-acetyl-ADP-ribose deacetylase (regulator of RNase III)